MRFPACIPAIVLLCGCTLTPQPIPPMEDALTDLGYDAAQDGRQDRVDIPPSDLEEVAELQDILGDIPTELPIDITDTAGEDAAQEEVLDIPCEEVEDLMEIEDVELDEIEDAQEAQEVEELVDGEDWLDIEQDEEEEAEDTIDEEGS